MLKLLFVIVLITGGFISCKKARQLKNEPEFEALSVFDGEVTQDLYKIVLTSSSVDFRGKNPQSFLWSDIKSFDLKQEISPDTPDIVIEKDKSVIGRALVGGLLLGSVGAIVGGMSGLGTKKEIKKGKKGERRLFAYFVTNKGQEYLFKVCDFSKNNASNFISAYRKRELSIAESSVS